MLPVLKSKDRVLGLSGQNKIGRRSSECQVVLNEPSVSGIHARIDVSKDGQNVILRDLKSTNGTYVNGKRIHVPTELHSNDQVQFGNETTYTLDFPVPDTERGPDIKWETFDKDLLLERVASDTQQRYKTELEALRKELNYEKLENSRRSHDDMSKLSTLQRRISKMEEKIPHEISSALSRSLNLSSGTTSAVPEKLFKVQNLSNPADESELQIDDWNMYEMLDKRMSVEPTEGFQKKSMDLEVSGLSFSSPLKQYALNDDDRKVLEKKRMEMAEDMRKLNQLSAGTIQLDKEIRDSLIYGEKLLGSPQNKGSNAHQQLSPPKNGDIQDNLFTFEEKKRSSPQNKRSMRHQILPPSDSDDTEEETEETPKPEPTPKKKIDKHIQQKIEAKIKAHRRVAVLAAFDHWRMKIADRMRFKHVYIILNRVFTRYQRRCCLRIITTWKTQATQLKQKFQIDKIKNDAEMNLKSQLHVMKERNQARVIKMLMQKNTEVAQKYFVAWTSFVHTTKCTIAKQTLKHRGFVLKSNWKQWKVWCNLIRTRKKLIWRKLVQLSRKRMRSAWTQWRFSSQVIASTHCQLKSEQAAQERESALQLYIKDLTAKLFKAQHQLDELKSVSNQQSIQSFQDQQAIIKSLRRQVDANADPVLEIDLYRRQNEKHLNSLQSAKSEVKGLKEEIEKLHHKIQSQHHRFTEQTLTFKNIVSEKNEKILLQNEVLARFASSEQPLNGQRYTAAKFLVEQINQINNENDIKLDSLRNELIQALNDAEEAQSECEKLQPLAKRTEVAEAALLQLQDESKSDDVFEAFQLIQILQRELSTKEQKIEDLNKRIFEMEESIVENGDSQGIINFLSHRVSELSQST